MSSNNGFNRWIEYARDCHLKGPRQAILLVIASRCNEGGRCFPSHDRIAQESGVGGTTVRAVIRSLARDGYLRIERTPEHKSNTYVLSGAIQPPLIEDEPVTRRHVNAHVRVSPDDHRPVTSRLANNHRTTKGTVQRSSPDGADLCRPDGGTSKDPFERFLTAEKDNERVAALIDLGRCHGLELKGDRLGSIVKRHGRSQAVIDALMAAIGHRALEPHDYMERILSNGRSGLQQAGRRPRGGARVAAAAGPDMDAWDRYGAGEG